MMCATLRDNGFTTAVSYDPIVPEFARTARTANSIS